MVSLFDERLSRLLDLCDELAVWESTVIAYVSDHGEMHGGHGMFWKSCFYESSVRIPMIVSWPGVFGSGARLSRVVSLVDLVRTLLDIGEADAEGCEGRSLRGLLEGREADGGGEAFAEYEANGTQSGPAA